MVRILTGKPITTPVPFVRRKEFQTDKPNDILFNGDDYLFKQCINNASCYGEYGSGNSTIYVKKNFPNIFLASVDTSKLWANKVNELLGGEVEYVRYIDVGDVGDFGRPLTYDYKSNFMGYAEAIWDVNRDFDLVLIDGRFRVLCFLTSLLNSTEGTKILFDDYYNRRHYHVVEQFIEPKDSCGRQALFEVTDKAKSEMDLDLIEFERQRFLYVFD